MTSRLDRLPEITRKLQQVRALLVGQQLDAVVLNQSCNTAWLTAGAATYINEATDGGLSTLVVTPDQALVVTDSVEAPRLTEEEKLADLGFTFVIERWYARGGELQKLLAGRRVGQDGPGAGRDLSAELRDLRRTLQPAEMERLRHIGQLASAAVNEAIRAVRPGMTEYEVAALLAAASRRRGGSATVNLVASDARIAHFRHPLPTNKTIAQYVMVVLCLRVEGLIAAVTRLAHFGPLPDDLRRRALAVAEVDARLILGTQPGRTLGEQWALAKEAYAAVGFPAAIEEHHQGGAIAYQPREILAAPHDPTPIQLDQAFAWNPSVRGVKSEDTILLSAHGIDMITATPDWPTWTISVDGQPVARPAILEM